jgi:hypothetical protein
VAVVLRTDFPVAPGTATSSTATITTASTATVSVSLYLDSLNLSASGTAGYIRDIATVSLNLARRSLVAAVAVLMHAYADTADVVDLILVIGGAEVTLQKLKDTPALAPYVLHGYRTLERGSYTVALRLRNNDTSINHYVYLHGAADTVGNKVLGYLIVYVVPLE